jgi:hypothetical protein
MRKMSTGLFVFLIVCTGIFAQNSKDGCRIETSVLPGENWWGGNIVDGRKNTTSPVLFQAPVQYMD